MVSPLCEVIIEETKIQPPGRFKGSTQDDVNIAKSMMRLFYIKAEEDKTRIEMKVGVGGELM